MEPKIKVFNKNTVADNEYDLTYVGRPTPLGNPFIIGKDGDRDEVIEKYKVWLEGQLRSENETRRMFDALFDELRHRGTLRLLCWCAPEPCHADVLAKRLLDKWYYRVAQAPY